MIKSIRIRNFQTLKSIDLDLSEGLNVISGISGSGKTSTIRSLDWGINNRPSGFGFRRDPRKDKTGKKPLSKDIDTEVELEFVDNEYAVVRARNELKEEGSNAYILIDGNDNEEVFGGLKTDVPDKISKIINISPYSFQKQHDPIFLLNDSPGVVAQKINELCGWEDVDIIRKRCDSIISKTKEQFDSVVEEIKDKQNEVKSLSFIDNLNEKIGTLEKLENDKLDVDDDLEELILLTDEINGIKDTIVITEELLKIESKCNRLNEMISIYDSIDKKYSMLSLLIDEIKDAKSKIEESEQALAIEIKVNKLDNLINQFNKASDKIEIISNYINQITNLERDIKQQELQLKQNQQEYKRLMKEAGSCPMCDASWKIIEEVKCNS